MRSGGRVKDGLPERSNSLTRPRSCRSLLRIVRRVLPMLEPSETSERPDRLASDPIEAMPPAEANQPGRWDLFPSAARSALLLGGLGLTGTVGAFTASRMSAVPSFVEANEMDWGVRRGLVASAVMLAVLAALVPLLAWWRSPIRVARIESAARRLSPLLPLSFVPVLSHWDAWESRPFVHLTFVSVLMLALHRAVVVAGGEPRIVRRWPGEALFERFAATPFSRHLPALLVFLGALTYAFYFSYYTLRAHEYGRTYPTDLGIFDNIQWQVLHGHGFLRATPTMGPGSSHFGRHATMLAYLYTPIYALHQGAETLLVLQAMLIGAGAIPLFYFAKRHTTVWAACVLSLAYLLYAPLHGSNSYDFHHLATSPIFIFALALAIEAGNAWAIAIATALTLACREDVAPAVAILGAYHVLAGTKPRLGLALVLVGAAYFVIVKFALMPLTGGSESFAGIYGALIPGGSRGFGGVLTTLASNPTFAFGLTANVPKMTYVLQMLVPVAFLAVRRPIGWLFLLPGIVFTVLSSDFVPHLRLSFQYTAFWTPYVFIASGLALSDESIRRTTTVDLPRARTALVFAVALGAWATSYQWGGFFQHHTMGSGFWEHFLFEPTEQQVEARADREEILRLVPGDAAVTATQTAVPHLTARRRIYSIGFLGMIDAEYAVIGLLELREDERAAIAEILRNGSMGLVAENRWYVLLRRGASTAENARLYRRIVRRRMPVAPTDDASAGSANGR